MIKNWIILADAACARIYAVNAASIKSPAELVKELQHPAARLKGQDLVTDKPGRYKSSGAARGAFVSHTDPKEAENSRFSIDIAHALEQGRLENHYKHLFICMPSHLYGLVKPHLSKQTEQLITKVIHKDYMHGNANELQDLINKLRELD